MFFHFIVRRSLGSVWRSLCVMSLRFGISGADGQCASSSSRRARSSNPETPKSRDPHIRYAAPSPYSRTAFSAYSRRSRM